MGSLKNPEKFAMVRSVALIRPCDKYLYPEYLATSIRSPYVQNQIWANVKQSAQPCLYINKIQSLMIPLPPLEEQKRIVAKVYQLMALCDEIEMRIRKSQEDGEKITNAVLSNLTAM